MYSLTWRQTGTQVGSLLSLQDSTYGAVHNLMYSLTCRQAGT